MMKVTKNSVHVFTPHKHNNASMSTHDTNCNTHAVNAVSSTRHREHAPGHVVAVLFLTTLHLNDALAIKCFS